MKNTQFKFGEVFGDKKSKHFVSPEHRTNINNFLAKIL